MVLFYFLIRLAHRLQSSKTILDNTHQKHAHDCMVPPLEEACQRLILLLECQTPMLLLTSWVHWMVHIRVLSLQWNFPLIWSLSLELRLLGMEHNLRPVFTESPPTLVYSACTFKLSYVDKRYKSVYWRPCYISPRPCHLRPKPLMRKVPSYPLYFPDLNILRGSKCCLNDHLCKNLYPKMNYKLISRRRHACVTELKKHFNTMGSSELQHW